MLPRAPRFVFAALTLAAALGMPAQASMLESTSMRAEAPQDAGYQALVAATNAVVGVRVRALPNAYSNDTLGPEREGSGIIIDDKGQSLVLTIGYLVMEADTVEIIESTGTAVPATVVAYDHATGFGLLRPLSKLTPRPIKLGTSSTVSQADRLMIVTGGEEQALSIATVVSRRQFAGYWEYLIDNAIFTSPARLDHSGAALIDKNGALVGVGSLFVLDAVEAGGKGPGNMFVPIDLLKPVLDELVRTGGQAASHRPYLGVDSLEEDGRVKVMQVNDESPAKAAGLTPGDIILSVDGQAIGSLETFYDTLWAPGNKAGTEFHLTVLHGPTTRDIVVHSTARDDCLRHKPAI
jgi:S1-C subfamily serine protease